MQVICRGLHTRGRSSGPDRGRAGGCAARPPSLHQAGRAAPPASQAPADRRSTRRPASRRIPGKSAGVLVRSPSARRGRRERRRPVPAAASVNAPAVVAGTRDDDEVGEVEDLRVAVPGRDFCERVGADDEENLRRVRARRVEAVEGVGGVRRARRGRARRRSPPDRSIAVDRQRRHREAVERRGARLLRPVRRHARGQQQDAVERQRARARRGRSRRARCAPGRGCRREFRGVRRCSFGEVHSESWSSRAAVSVQLERGRRRALACGGDLTPHRFEQRVEPSPVAAETA